MTRIVKIADSNLQGKPTQFAKAPEPVIRLGGPQQSAPGTQVLPSEMLGEIFVQCLPRHGRVQPRRDQAPLVLMGVCRHWQLVAKTTPQLWTSLSADLALLHNCPDRVLEWLRRAKSCSISLTIQPSPGDRQLGDLKNRLVMHPYDLGYLEEFRSKFERIEIDLCSSKNWIETLKGLRFKLGRESLHTLTTLVVRGAESIQSALAMAPSLQILQIDQATLGTMQAITSSTLRVLCMGTLGRSLPDLVDILDNCPALEHLEAGLKSDDNGPECIGPREYLGLRHLGIYSPTLRAVSACLASLILPGLSSFSCRGSLDAETLRSFVHRSGCELTTFYGMLGSAPELWPHLLEALPAVRTLEVELLEGYQGPKAAWGNLVKLFCDHTLSPVLEEMRVKMDSHIQPDHLWNEFADDDRYNAEARDWKAPIEYGDLSEMLAERRGATPLRSFRMAIQTYDEHAIWELDDVFKSSYWAPAWYPTAAERDQLDVVLIKEDFDFVLRVDVDPMHVEMLTSTTIPSLLERAAPRNFPVNAEIGYYDDEILRIGTCAQWPN
ncbi:hypothetical protein C8F01DRAFT_1261615 [Mycena amicta]|nr:hypothetical protein C8F01DRAFT_1261615 [Mycena amicta]